MYTLLLNSISSQLYNVMIIWWTCRYRRDVSCRAWLYDRYAAMWNVSSSDTHANHKLLQS